MEGRNLGMQKGGFFEDLSAFVAERETVFSKLSNGFFGFMMLFPFNINLALGAYAVRRFGCDDKLSGLFINHFHAFITFAGFISLTVMAALVAVLNKICASKRSQKMINAMLSVIIMIFIFAIALLTTIVYATGEGNQNLMAYFVMLCLSFCAYCLNGVLVPKVNGKHANVWSGFIPFGAVFFSLFIMFLIFVTPDTVDVNLWIPVNVHIAHTVLSFINLAIWFLYHYNVTIKQACEGVDAKYDMEVNDVDEVGSFGLGSLLRAMKNAVSPMTMTVISQFITYVVFPGFLPFVFSKEECVKIILMILLVDGITALVYNVLCGNMTTGQITNIAANWRKEGKLWNFLWLLMLPYIIIPILIISAAQNRDGELFASYKNSVALVAFVGAIFKLSGTLMYNGGYGACYATASEDDDVDNRKELEAASSSLVSIQFYLMALLMTLGSLFGAGYIGAYNKALDALEANGSWPTSSMSNMDAFFDYWLKNIFTEIGDFFKDNITLAERYIRN